MTKCSFCDKHIEPGTGIIYAAADSVYHLCSSKCLKNRKLGRDKLKMKWISKKGISKEEIKEELLEEGKEEAEAKKGKLITQEEKKEETKPEEKAEKKEEKSSEQK